MSGKKFVVLFLGLFSGFFVLVGLVLLFVNTRLSQATEQAADLPLLNAAQLSQASPGTVALIEGKIAERNTLHAEGFVVYLRRLYRGERCDIQSGTATPKCEDVWTEEERVTPPVWLDLPDGRIRLANADYALQRPPAVWQSTGTLIKDQTVRYEGFKLNNPVLPRARSSLTGQAPRSGPIFCMAAIVTLIFPTGKVRITSSFGWELLLSSSAALCCLVWQSACWAGGNGNGV